MQLTHCHIYDDIDFAAVLPPGGIVLEQWLTREANRWSGVTLTALKTVGISGVEQSSLSVGRGWIDAHGLVSLFGAVLTSMAYGTGSIFAVFPPGDGMVKDGSGGS
ncbi:putative GMC-type oxidoreductase [Hordeum vulgare]|nr:putative GMC-type oxidoreductase [Hordeum vulgare]KAE8779948.1 putative GMC-type oxidoreductase [Hordeum vulgare]